MATISLDKLEQNKSGIVREINLETQQAMRVMEMGLLPDVVIVMVRKAPMGDPIEFRVGMTVLSLRKSEASQVTVEVNS